MDTTTIIESASQFGLTHDEILETVTITIDRLPEEAKAPCIDELAGALATRLIEKERAVSTAAPDRSDYI
jgi:hypothetical protein